MKPTRQAQGYEFYIHYDQEADIYEVFLDDKCHDCIGSGFDTLDDANDYITYWLADRAA